MGMFERAEEVEIINEVKTHGKALGKQMLEAMGLIKRPLPSYIQAISHLTEESDLQTRDARINEAMAPVVEEINQWSAAEKAFIKGQLSSLADLIVL